VISRSPDPSSWIRRVAVRSTIRSWRRMLARVGIGRPRPIGDGVDSRTGALLTALGKLSAAERRAVVLTHMAGVSLGEISALEQVSIGSVQARLSRARQVVSEGMAEVLPLVLEGAIGEGYNADDGFDVFGSGERGSDGYGPAYGPGNYRPGDFDAEGYGTPYGGEGDRAGDDYRGEHR
jgi:Sigma-70, region 4